MVANTAPENADAQPSLDVRTKPRKQHAGWFLATSIFGMLVGLGFLFAEILEQQPLTLLWKYRLGVIGILMLAAGILALLKLRKRPSVTGVVGNPVKTWIESEITFYSHYASQQCICYRLCKIPALVAAATIPIFALHVDSSPVIAAGLGALIAVLESLQQLCRFHENWINAVATRDSLDRELQLFSSEAGLYASQERAKSAAVIFAERIAAIIEGEQSHWFTVQLNAAKGGDNIKP